MDTAPPFDNQAEQGVLGSILIDDTAFAKVVEMLSAESFYSIRHILIYAAMQTLFDEGRPTDLVMVSAELKRRAKLSAAGGDWYIFELGETVPFPRNVVYYAQIVQEKSELRQLAIMAGEVGAQAYDPASKSSDIINELASRVFDGRAPKKEYRALSSVVERAYELVESTKLDGVPANVIRTGFKCLDDELIGFMPKEYIVLGARPSMGKTALALRFSLNAAKNNIPVGFISIEMSETALGMRLLAMESGVSLRQMRRGWISREELEKIKETQKKLSTLPIYVDDTALQNSTTIRARARRLQVQHEVKLIIVDHLQKIQPMDDKETSLPAITTKNSAQLVMLAKELNVPIFVISQLSRELEKGRRNKRPQLSDLRESGSIEQDADVVLMIYRQAYYDIQDPKKRNEELDNTSEIFIAKNRNGPQRHVELLFMPETADFVPLEKDHETPPAHQGKIIGLNDDDDDDDDDDLFKGDDNDDDIPF